MTLKAQTLSVVVGTEACNAQCPFCVGKMNHSVGVTKSINWRNFERTLMLCDKAEISTALLTGKGEPTLYPDQISSYLNVLNKRMPFNELQTNGIRLPSLIDNGTVRGWYNSGLTTMCISVVHYNRKANASIYSKDYPRLTDLIKDLHDIGLSVRLSVVCIQEYIDSPQMIYKMIDFAKDMEVEQLTFRPAIQSEELKDTEAQKWVNNHIFPAFHFDYNIASVIVDQRNKGAKKAVLLRKLIHGGEVYDINGQNVCFTNCMTLKPDTNELRQIIFYPDGHLRYDWGYKGAILL